MAKTVLSQGKTMVRFVRLAIRPRLPDPHATACAAVAHTTLARGGSERDQRAGSTCAISVGSHARD